jgi:hypothetical protein
MLMIQEKRHVNIKSKPVHVKRTLALRWLCPQLAVGKPLNPVHHIRTLHGRRFPPWASEASPVVTSHAIHDDPSRVSSWTLKRSRV